MAENIGENFRGGRGEILCGKCGSHKENQEEIFNICPSTKQSIDTNSLNYSNLFEEEVPASLNKTITKIKRERKKKEF